MLPETPRRIENPAAELLTDSTSLLFDRQHNVSVWSPWTDSALLRLVAVVIAVRGARMFVPHLPSAGCVIEPAPAPCRRTP